MTTTFPHLFTPADAAHAGLANLKSLVLEPIFVISACLFWIVVLPITGAFCASIALYHKIGSLNDVLRLPDLRHNPARNPLVVRKKKAPEPKTPSRTRDPAPALQS